VVVWGGGGGGGGGGGVVVVCGGGGAVVWGGVCGAGAAVCLCVAAGGREVLWGGAAVQPAAFSKTALAPTSPPPPPPSPAPAGHVARQAALPPRVHQQGGRLHHFRPAAPRADQADRAAASHQVRRPAGGCAARARGAWRWGCCWGLPGARAGLEFQPCNALARPPALTPHHPPALAPLCSAPPQAGAVGGCSGPHRAAGLRPGVRRAPRQARAAARAADAAGQGGAAGWLAGWGLRVWHGGVRRVGSGCWPTCPSHACASHMCPGCLSPSTRPQPANHPPPAPTDTLDTPTHPYPRRRCCAETSRRTTP
jgi:hypothetical protein